MPPNAGWNRPLPRPCSATKATSAPEGQMSRRIGERETADDHGTREVRADQQEPAGIAIGKDAADQERCHEPQRFHHQHDPERARFAGQRERAPAQCNDEGRVTDLRHGLPDPEEAEVAVSERLEDTESRRGAHRRKAILRACRIGSESQPCR